MPSSSKRDELSVHESCILWSSQVVVLQKGQEMVLEELHEGHSGTTQIKALARMYMWLSEINKDN